MNELTPEAAQSQANEIMGDKSGPYWDRKHQAHKETVSKVADLMAVAHQAQVARSSLRWLHKSDLGPCTA